MSEYVCTQNTEAILLLDGGLGGETPFHKHGGINPLMGISSGSCEVNYPWTHLKQSVSKPGCSKP